VTGSASLAKLLSILIIGLASGHPGGAAASTGESAVAGPVGHRGIEGRPVGDWEASGRDWMVDGVDAFPHSYPRRHWRFVTDCRGHGCRTFFLRTTSGGIQRALLRPRDGYFVADFGPYREPCEGVPGTPGTYASHFKLRWSAGGDLKAEERARYGGSCTHERKWTRWSAEPAGGSSGVSEASDQML
jgi:hypothetical protein